MLSHHAAMEAQAESEGKEDVAVYRQHQVLHPRAAEFKEEAELGIRLTERALHIIDPLSSAADECIFTQTERGRMLREHHHKEPRGKKHVSKQVLAMLAHVAEELNEAQAEMEVRRQLKNMSSEPESGSGNEVYESYMLDSEVIRDMVLGSEMPQEVKHALKKMEALPTHGDQPAVPAVLARKKPEQRWSHFQTVQWLNPSPKLEMLAPRGAQPASDTDSDDEPSPSTPSKVATGNVFTRYIQEGRESWMTLMQQRKREAYMELLSNLISSKYEAAKQRLAAVTIQRHWRKRWQERNVQAAEALKALQSDLRALMCAPGMPGAWEDAPRPQLTRTEVVTERCVGAPPPADGDGEWEEELDENGYMRSDSTKVWKRSVMRVITYSPPAASTPSTEEEEEVTELEPITIESPTARVSFYGPPPGGKPMRRRRRNRKQEEALEAQHSDSGTSTDSRYSLNHSFSSRISVAGMGEGLSIMPMGSQGLAAQGSLRNLSRLAGGASGLSPAGAAAAAAAARRAQQLKAEASKQESSGEEGSEEEDSEDSDTDDSIDDSDSECSSDEGRGRRKGRAPAGRGGRGKAGAKGGKAAGKRRGAGAAARRKDTGPHFATSDRASKPRKYGGLTAMTAAMAARIEANKHNGAQDGRPAWGRPAGPKVKYDDEDRWKAKRKVTAGPPPKMNLHVLERAAARVRPAAMVQVRNAVAAAAAAAAARFAHIQAQMAAAAARTAVVVKHEPEAPSRKYGSHNARSYRPVGAGSHDPAAHDSGSPPPGDGVGSGSPPPGEVLGRSESQDRLMAQYYATNPAGFQSLTGQALAPKGAPGVRSGSTLPGEPGHGAAGAQGFAAAPLGEGPHDGPLLALAELLVQPAVHKTLKSVGHLVHGLSRDVEMAAAMAHQYLHRRSRSGGAVATAAAAAVASANADEEEEEEAGGAGPRWALTGRVALHKGSAMEAVRARWAARTEAKAAARAEAATDAVDQLLQRRQPQPQQQGLSPLVVSSGASGAPGKGANAAGHGKDQEHSTGAKAMERTAIAPAQPPPAANRPWMRIRGAPQAPPPDLAIAGAAPRKEAPVVAPGFRIPAVVRRAANGGRVRSLVAIRRQARQQAHLMRQQQLQQLSEGLSSGSTFVQISRGAGGAARPGGRPAAARGAEQEAALTVMLVSKPLTTHARAAQATAMPGGVSGGVEAASGGGLAAAVPVPLGTALKAPPRAHRPGAGAVQAGALQASPQARQTGKSPTGGTSGNTSPTLDDTLPTRTTSSTAPELGEGGGECGAGSARTPQPPAQGKVLAATGRQPAAVPMRSPSPARGGNGVGAAAGGLRSTGRRNSSSLAMALPEGQQQLAPAAASPFSAVHGQYDVGAPAPTHHASRAASMPLGPMGVMMPLGGLGAVTGSALRTRDSATSDASSTPLKPTSSNHLPGSDAAAYQRAPTQPPPLALLHPLLGSPQPLLAVQPLSEAPLQRRPQRRSSIEYLGVGPPLEASPAIALAATGRAGRARRGSVETPSAPYEAPANGRPPRSRRNSLGPLPAPGDLMVARSGSSVPHLPTLPGHGGGHLGSQDWLSAKLAEYSTSGPMQYMGWTTGIQQPHGHHAPSGHPHPLSSTGRHVDMGGASEPLGVYSGHALHMSTGHKPSQQWGGSPGSPSLLAMHAANAGGADGIGALMQPPPSPGKRRALPGRASSEHHAWTSKAAMQRPVVGEHAPSPALQHSSSAGQGGSEQAVDYQLPPLPLGSKELGVQRSGGSFTSAVQRSSGSFTSAVQRSGNSFTSAVQRGIGSFTSAGLAALASSREALRAP